MEYRTVPWETGLGKVINDIHMVLEKWIKLRILVRPSVTITQSGPLRYLCLCPRSPFSWLWTLRNTLSFKLAFSSYLLQEDKLENPSDQFS